MTRPGLPPKQGLYDPYYEHDACGVGFVAHLKGKKSHSIVRQGLQILENLEHRGACGCDPLTGDGAGILIQMPDKFLRREALKLHIELPKEGQYGVGLVFLPTRQHEKNMIEEWLEEIIHEEGQRFLGWREVPHDSNQIGRVAHSVEPEFRQIFIGRGKDVRDDLEFERKLYVIRRRIELKVAATNELGQRDFFYICSLSARTLVYKGQLTSPQVDRFFNDLSDEDMVSAIALVHSRYSTNTFPSWSLAHPYRMIAHNGEINTLRGNINWMRAREKQFVSDKFGEDLKKVIPTLNLAGSDSAIFDNALELIVLAGRSLPHAVMMMVPEAWSGHESMDADKKAFYEYHSCLMEPWDGPAAIAFTDGRYIGAILDRNGLRPSRWLVTDDDLIVMASESGVLPIEPTRVLSRGRLQPGKMFLVDTVEGRIVEDAEIKHEVATRKPYKSWVEKNITDLKSLPKPKHLKHTPPADLAAKQMAFGYTLEDLKIVLKPMAEGEEATGSMGHDTPLAVLSKLPQPLSSYFKQLFAQVTNPPVDAIREEIIMGSDVMLGAEQNLLDESAEHARRLRAELPVLTSEELEQVREFEAPGLKSATLETVFRADQGVKGLEPAMEKLFKDADEAVRRGATILILSDRAVDARHAAIPSLLATAGLHHHFIRKGTRTRVSLIAETGEAREMHHFATLIGYGANAVNPYLAFETIEHEIKVGHYGPTLDYTTAKKNFVKAARKGLFKITSKMGISTIQSYCGAQIFEAVGLGEKLIERYFTATPSRIGGIGIEEIAREALLRHERAYPHTQGGTSELEEGGSYHWRRDGEYHMYNPESIALLQHSVRSGDYKIFKKYTAALNDFSKNSATIRGLLKFKKGEPVAISEVEPATEIVKRFATGAMSYGSISKEMHETLAIAMNRLGGFSNTGEGGEDPDRFKKDANGDWRRSRIKQVAQGRFGVTIEYLVNADQLQIKMAQGAKPGEGGQLPGHKVSKEIAATRLTTPGVGLISPPPHHDIYSIEDLAQLIHDLKNSNRFADVSVKLVSEIGVGTVAAGVSKGKSDHVLISGFEGGTGASPQTSIKHAGLPMELGIAEAQQVLVLNDLRGRIRVQTDGQLKTGRDIVVAAMLGADEFGFSTSALVVSGCILLRKCHLNTCSVGIATQDPELRKKFTGKPEHVVNYFMYLAEEVREIMAELGVRKFDDLIGRVDWLEQREDVDHWKAKHLDLSKILHRPDVPADVAIRHTGRQDHGLDKALDMKLLEICKEAIESQKPVKAELVIQNTNRTVGTILSSDIARKYGMKGLPEGTIELRFRGSAGQSFGAFLSKGVTLRLEGDGNDYVGKGLSGGRIIVTPDRNARYVPENNMIVGNVVLYGGIQGELYARGLAGERFAVRNSGVETVVEGVGDHGCEYMTGGVVVVIGPTGRNFAAGMSGGLAYIWDQDKTFASRCNKGMVELVPVVESSDLNKLKGLIDKQFEYTGSTVAKGILDRWPASAKEFVKVYPTDYKRVLEEAAKAAGAVNGSAGTSAKSKKETVHG